MKARYSERIHAKGRVIIAVGPHVNEGRIHNLTVPGCLLEGPLCVNKGDSIKLKLFLPGLHSPFSVDLAVVRWINGCQFGVEFIKMGERDQRELHRFLAQDLADQAVKKKGTRQQFSDPGGQNWHLESYSLARREAGSVP